MEIYSSLTAALRRSVGNSGEVCQAQAGARSGHREPNAGRAEHASGRCRGASQLQTVARRQHQSQQWRGDHYALLIRQPLLALLQGLGPVETSNKPGPAYLKRWQQLSALRQHFWRKWSTDYLLSL